MIIPLSICFIVILLGLFFILRKASLNILHVSIVMIPVIVASFVLYSYWGGWRLIQSQESYEAMVATLNELYEEPELTPNHVRETLAQLSQDLPEHPFLWYRLGEIYERLGWHQQSKESYHHALKLLPESVETQIKFTYASALSEGGLLDDEAKSIVLQLLQSDEQNLPALNLLAMDAYKRGHYKEAIIAWKQMLALVNLNGGVEGKAIQKALDQAYSKLGVKQLEVKVNQLGIRVKVDVAVPNLGDVSNDTPVFVFARAKDKPGPPVAVLKMSLGDLPKEVLLTQEHAMQQNHALDLEQDIIVTARLALSGQPIASSGDWQGQSEQVHVTGMHDVDIIINEKI